MKITRMAKLSGLFAVAACCAVAAYHFGIVGVGTPADAVEAKEQSLITISTQPGSLYESVGKTHNLCTITYHGDGVATSAAHCVERLLTSNISADRYVKFHCDEKVDDGWGCSSETVALEPSAVITEIAIPKQYVLSRNGQAELQKQSRGYDIAYIRLVPVKGATLPAANFPLSDRIEMLNVSQAGYNYTKPGLTGEPHCTIFPSDRPSYTVKTNCYAIEGSSGSALLDEHHQMIGVMSTSAFRMGIDRSYATPITPGLKLAFEKFRNATLDGEIKIYKKSHGSLKVIRFPYERAPVAMNLNPCC